MTEDRELIDLGRDFEAAFAVEEAARAQGKQTDDWGEWDAAFAATDAIVQRILTLPASSLRGLQIKARCVQWCHGDEPIHISDNRTTDMKLVTQIVADLLAVTT